MNIKMKSIPGLASLARELGMTTGEAAEHLIRSELKPHARNFFARNSPSQGRTGCGGDVVMFKRRPRGE